MRTDRAIAVALGAMLASAALPAQAEEPPPQAERLALPALPEVEAPRPDPRPALRVAKAIFAKTPPPPCPKGMAHLGRSCVDRYEAHLVVRNGEGAFEAHPHNERPPDDGTYFEARSDKGVMPQAYISRVESELACKNAGKRLCGFREWRSACGSRKGKRYPYGWGGRRGACNTGKKHLLHEFFGDSGWTYENFNDPKLNVEPGYLAETGSHEACATEHEVFDMNGNLHEWVSSTVTEDFVERLEDEDVERVDQPWVVGNGMFLGGFYSTTDQHGPGCLYTTIAHEPTYHDYSTGFRCCATAKKPPKD